MTGVARKRQLIRMNLALGRELRGHQGLGVDRDGDWSGRKLGGLVSPCQGGLRTPMKNPRLNPPLPPRDAQGGGHRQLRLGGHVCAQARRRAPTVGEGGGSRSVTRSLSLRRPPLPPMRGTLRPREAPGGGGCWSPVVHTQLYPIAGVAEPPPIGPGGVRDGVEAICVSSASDRETGVAGGTGGGAGGRFVVGARPEATQAGRHGPGAWRSWRGWHCGWLQDSGSIYFGLRAGALCWRSGFSLQRRIGGRRR